MKKYYLAKIHQVEEPDLGMVNTTVFSKYKVSAMSQQIPTDERGMPTKDFALVLVSAEDHTQWEKDPDIIPLENDKLTDSKSESVDFLSAKGIEILLEKMSTTEGFVDAISKEIDPKVTGRLDVSESAVSDMGVK